MRINEYKKMWSEYFNYAIGSNDFYPTNEILKKYYESYQSIGNKTNLLTDFMPEPYLGDFDTATIAQVNLNPGPTIEFQHWTTGSVSEEYRKMKNEGIKDFYDEWAKRNIYMDYENAEELDNGMKFIKNRVPYFEHITGKKINKSDLVNMEVFAWHSDKFGKIKNMSEVFREFVLEPLSDTNIKYIFLLRNPIIEAAEEAGVELKVIDHKWNAAQLEVKVGKFKDKIFIATKNGIPGYPGDYEDREKIKQIVEKMLGKNENSNIVEEKEMFDDLETEVQEKSLFIRINKEYRDGMSKEELFKATSFCWRLALEKAKQVDYVFSIYQSIIVEIYKPTKWYEVKDIETNTNKITFNGEIAEDSIRNKYIGKSVKHYFKPGEQNPCKYINI